MPLFSIITPSFNQIDWLRRCIASVRDQARVGLPPDGRTTGSGPVDLRVEHIVQDAGTEGIERLAADLGAVFFRDGIRVEVPAATQPDATDSGTHPSPPSPAYRLEIHVERDSGMYDAINRGLARATGDYCAYLNCDEQYLPDVLARVATGFASHRETDVWFGDMIVAGPDGTPLAYRQTLLPNPTFIQLNQLNTPTCATFFRRSLVERGFLFPARWKTIGDAVWMSDLLRAGTPMRTLGFPTSVFFLTGSNLGADDRAMEEMRAWRRAPGAPPAWLRLPSAALFRIRKWLAGAYRVRDCTVEVHSGDGSGQRQARLGARLPTGWPQPPGTVRKH